MKACCALTRHDDGKPLPALRVCRAAATETVNGKPYCTVHATKARGDAASSPTTRR